MAEKSTPVTETPEFKAALAEGIESAIEHLLPTLLERIGGARASGATGEDNVFAQQLAFNIARMSSQETGKVYVDPAEMEARKRAMTELSDLLVEFRHADRCPTYRLKAKTQLPKFMPHANKVVYVLYESMWRDDATRTIRDTEIDWPGMPNLAMVPINAEAEQAMALFCRAIGEETSIPKEDELGPMALTRAGVVVRGRAAQSVLLNTRAYEQAQEPEHVAYGRPPATGADLPMFAKIRKGADSDKRLVNVLGSQMDPIEVR